MGDDDDVSLPELVRRVKALETLRDRLIVLVLTVVITATLGLLVYSAHTIGSSGNGAPAVTR